MLLIRLGFHCAGNPYGYADITAWSVGARVVLNAWQFETLHHLSKAYVSASHEYADKNKPAPYMSAPRKQLHQQAVQQSWMGAKRK